MRPASRRGIGWPDCSHSATSSKGTQQLIDEVLAKSPRDTDALILRGDIALANSDPKSAIVDLRTVLRDQPQCGGRPADPGARTSRERRAGDRRGDDASGARVESAGSRRASRPGAAARAARQGGPGEGHAAGPGQGSAEQRAGARLVVPGQRRHQGLRHRADGGGCDGGKRAEVAGGLHYQGILAEEATHTAEALRLYSRAVELQPEAFEPLQAETRLLVQTGRQPEALRLLDELIAKDQKNAFAPDIKGEVLVTQKDLAGAQTAYKVAIARAPAWWPAYRGLATAQFAAKDTDAAVATLRAAEAAVTQPDLPGIDLATYYERVGKPEEAMREYDGVVKRAPQSEVAANNLAMLLVTYGKDAASIDRAKSLTARFADSSNPSFLDTYAWVLYKHGEAAASVPVLQRVVAEEPNAPVVFYHLGMAQSQAGSKAQALDNLTKAVNSGAKFSGLDEAKATLDKLAAVPVASTPKT